MLIPAVLTRGPSLTRGARRTGPGRRSSGGRSRTWRRRRRGRTPVQVVSPNFILKTKIRSIRISHLFASLDVESGAAVLRLVHPQRLEVLRPGPHNIKTRFSEPRLQTPAQPLHFKTVLSLLLPVSTPWRRRPPSMVCAAA